MGALNGNGYVRGSQWVRGKCGLKDRSPGLLLCFPTSCCCLFSQQMVLSTCCARAEWDPAPGIHSPGSIFGTLVLPTASGATFRNRNGQVWSVAAFRVLRPT